jgi:hypothetical protein
MNGGVYGVGVTDMTSGQQTTWSFGGPPYGVTVAVAKDVPFVYGGSGGFYDPTIHQFKRDTGELLVSYQPHSAPVPEGFALTGNGRLVYVSREFTGSSDDEYKYRIGIIGSATFSVEKHTHRQDRRHAIFQPDVPVRREQVQARRNRGKRSSRQSGTSATARAATG